MASAGRVGFDLEGELTLLDLVLIVQEFTQNDDETVATVTALLESGRVRVRRPAGSSGNTPGRPRRVRREGEARLASEPLAETGQAGRDEPPWPESTLRRLQWSR